MKTLQLLDYLEWMSKVHIRAQNPEVIVHDSAEHPLCN